MIGILRLCADVIKKSFAVIITLSVVMFLTAKLLATPIAKIYVGYDAELFEMTLHAFDIYSYSFLFAGVAIFGSSFFTALNDGFTSAAISSTVA